MTDPIENEEDLDTPAILDNFKEATAEVDPELLDDSPEMIKAAYDEFVKDSYDPAYEEEILTLDED